MSQKKTSEKQEEMSQECIQRGIELTKINQIVTACHGQMQLPVYIKLKDICDGYIERCSR